LNASINHKISKKCKKESKKCKKKLLPPPSFKAASQSVPLSALLSKENALKR